LIVWVLGIGEVPITKVIVIDSIDMVAGSSAKGMFTIKVYQGIPGVIDKFDRSGAFVSEVMSWDIVSSLSSYSVPLSGAFYAGW
jgi:hypothetical protein